MYAGLLSLSRDFYFMTETPKNSSWLLRQLSICLERAGLSRCLLIVPALLGLLTSLGEGLSVGLLYPLVQALLADNYAALQQSLTEFRLSFLSDFFPERRGLIIFLFTLVFFSAAAKTIFSYLGSLAVIRGARSFEAGLRQHIFQRYLNFGKSFYDRQSAGDINNILMSQVSKVADMFNKLNLIFQALFISLIYSGLMLWLSWKLTLLVLLLFPVVYLSLRQIVRRTQITSLDQSRKVRELAGKVGDTINCLNLIKAYTREQEEGRRFASLSQSVADLQYNMDRKNLALWPIQELLMLFFLAMFLAAVALFGDSSGESQVATALLFIVIMRRLNAQVGAFNSFWGALAAVAGPLADLERFMGVDDKGELLDGKIACTGMRSAITFEAVGFSYPNGNIALKDLSCSFKLGQVTALVGQTGSGKSTIVSLLMRFFDPQLGQILVDGQPLNSLQVKSWRQQIAWVSQDNYIFNATLYENLTYGLDTLPSDHDLTLALEQARFTDVLKKLPAGLQSTLGERGVMLSGGEKQRLAIARAILKQANILILDEATSALDVITESQVKEALQALMPGKTCIVIAHRLSTIAHADHIIVLENGRLLEEGSFEALRVKKGKFHEFWQEQSIN